LTTIEKQNARNRRRFFVVQLFNKDCEEWEDFSCPLGSLWSAENWGLYKDAIAKTLKQTVVRRKGPSYKPRKKQNEQKTA
jgi:hypothetical protein